MSKTFDELRRDLDHMDVEYVIDRCEEISTKLSEEQARRIEQLRECVGGSCGAKMDARDKRIAELEKERDESFAIGVGAAFRWVENLPKEDDEVAKKLFDEALARPDVQASLLKARFVPKTTGCPNGVPYCEEYPDCGHVEVMPDACLQCGHPPDEHDQRGCQHNSCRDAGCTIDALSQKRAKTTEGSE